MAEIRVKVESGQLEELLQALGGGGAGRAAARAVNKTATSLRRLILRELSAQIGLAQRRLRNQTEIQRARVTAVGRVAAGREVVVGGRVVARASVTAAGADITATAFNVRQTRAGVSYSPGRKARRQRVRGAFLAQMPRGYEGAFIRATETANVLVGDAEGVRRRRRIRRGDSDVPIAKLLLPGVSRAMFDDAVQDRIQREGQRTLANNIVDEVRAELRGFTRRRTRRRGGRR